MSRKDNNKVMYILASNVFIFYPSVDFNDTHRNHDKGTVHYIYKGENSGGFIGRGL